MPAELRRAAVLGSPIRHSLSPVLHRAAYAELGLTWRYDAIEVQEHDLASFLDTCGPEWVGLSLTMPLKRAVLPLLDTASAMVGIVGAANTVVLDGARRHGHNTDVQGIVDALAECGAEPGPATIVGAGATAASAIAALAGIGCPSVVVRARRPEAVETLRPVADACGIDLAGAGWPTPDAPLGGESRIVVCTVPGSAADSLLGAIPQAPGVLLDVSYDPSPTPLVRAWRGLGGSAVAGEVMLLHQAAAQVELMTGRQPDIATMRAALLGELERRAAAD